MKQPRSSSYGNNKQLIKKPFLPFFKPSKLPIKIQQISSNNHSQIFFNIKLIPFQILSSRKSGDPQKIIINSNDIIVIQATIHYKGFFNCCFDPVREWIQVNLGENFSHITIKKVGDQNTFINQSNILCWDRLEQKHKKLLTTINIKQIIKGKQKRPQQTNIWGFKDEIDKQLKLYITNLSIKKHSRKMTQKLKLQSKYQFDRSTCTLKNKNSTNKYEQINLSTNKKFHQTSTVSSSISAINSIIGIRPFTNQIHQINNNKISQLTRLTGKSQQQTSICNHTADQSSFIVNNFQSKPNNVDITSRRRNKFDSQPYFYQNPKTQLQFPIKINSMNKFSNHSHQHIQKQQKQHINLLSRNNTQQIVDSLKNKSIYQSQQQVQQDIKRVQDMQDSLSYPKNGDKSIINQLPSSSKCNDSKHQSSGTLYQSKYQ